MFEIFSQTSGVEKPKLNQTGLPNVTADEGTVTNLLTLVFGAAAALAVIIIIMAAIYMAKSEGNPEEISKARKTIIYALVGMVVALMAEAIVFFVLRNL